jgi:adenosylhomocysteine nucleosidase
MNNFVFSSKRLCLVWCYLAVLGVMLQGRSLQAQLRSDGGIDTTPRVAIISAFEPELEKLRGQAEIKEVRVINGRKHYLGRLAGHDVVLLLSGYSMVNASITSQALLDHFTIHEIIFSGIAGGVNPNLQVGDVTVPAEWGQYQEQVFAREIPTGWDAGRMGKEFPNYGMMFPHSASVVRRDAEADKQERRFWFPSDEEALKTVRRIAASVKLNRCLEGSGCLKTEPKVVVGGNGVSGPTFVDNAAYRQWVWQTFQADALDMETAAVATVAYINAVPFIAFRSLSDLAGGGGGKNESSVFFKLAADNSAAVVVAYLNASARN